jgi:DNA-binding CsgD family transcriptional regulator
MIKNDTRITLQARSLVMKGKKFEFTEKQVKYVLENWGKESAHSMKKRFGCSWYAIVKIAEENKLELPTSNNWTKEEINMLRLLAEKYHYEDIAKKMNKTENAIYLKARKLGITLIMDRRKWTLGEEQKLKELWGNQRIELIAKKLKRTVFSLKVKAVRMGLGPMISNNYEKIIISDISELLDVSTDRIYNTWIQLGLNITMVKLTKEKSYMTVTWNDLMRFLKDNQNEWDSRKIEKNILGPEPKWLIKKRAKDLKENPLWYRKWTIEEIREAESLFNSGKDYASIATKLKRSECAVANLLRNMGYAYRLPQFWKGKELIYLRENYKKMTYAEIAEILGRTEKAISYKSSEMGFQKKLDRRRKK